MKLTILHIFLILLLALVLCSTLGGNCGREGYSQQSDSDTTQYKSYGGKNGYDANLNDANISATDWSMGLNDDVNNPYLNKHDEFHRNYKNHGGNSGGGGYGGDGDYDNDMNSGDYSDKSAMNSGSYKNSNNKYSKYDRAYRRESQNDNMFDSVSTGAINGSLFNSSNSYSDSYSDSYPDKGKRHGVSKKDIPDGQEDLYILKSQIVPPVCPACPRCPDVNCDDKCGSGKKCPPCPSCARCPEPAFECKKVPNYSSANIMGNLPISWADKLNL
jgi:hypothetical protein